MNNIRKFIEQVDIENYNSFEDLIIGGVDINGHCEYTGTTAIHQAARRNLHRFVDRLLEEPHLRIDTFDGQGKLPWEAAYDLGQYAMAKKLQHQLRLGSHLNASPK